MADTDMTDRMVTLLEAKLSAKATTVVGNGKEYETVDEVPYAAGDTVKILVMMGGSHPPPKVGYVLRNFMLVILGKTSAALEVVVKDIEQFMINYVQTDSSHPFSINGAISDTNLDDGDSYYGHQMQLLTKWAV